MNKSTLADFAKKLTEMKDSVHRNLNEIDSSLLQHEGTEDLDEIDHSNNLAEISRLNNLKSQQKTRLLQIDAAEKRMASNQFGICVNCEEDIPKARLLANPLSIRCLECQEDLEVIQKEKKMVKKATSAPAMDSDED